MEGLIWYAGHMVTIEFTYLQGGPMTIHIGDFGDALDPAATLILPDGTQVSDDDSGEVDDAMIVFTADNPAPSGVYHLIIRGEGGTAGRFSVLAIPEAYSEPTTMLAFGQRVEGRIADYSNLHIFYTFYAQVGDFINIALTDYGSGFDPFLTLQGPEGFTPMMDDDSGPDDDALIVVGPAAIPGIYTIGVMSSPAHPSVGPYALILASNVTNDRLISAGETVVDSISRAGQKDRYVFVNLGGGEITFHVDDFDPLHDTGGTLDPFLTLYNAADEWVATDDNSALNDNAFISTTEMAGVIEISGGPTLTTGTYRLSYLTGPYVLPMLKIGSSNETYVFAGESEWYSFSGAAGQLVSIGVDNLGEMLDPAFRLYGPGGTLLAESLNAFPPPESAAQIRFFPLPATGLYKVEVLGEKNTYGRARVTFQQY